MALRRVLARQQHLGRSGGAEARCWRWCSALVARQQHPGRSGGGIGAGAARWWRGSSTRAGQVALRRGGGAGAARRWRGSSTQAGQVALRRGVGAGAARWWRGSSTQAGQAALRRGVGGAAARCWRGGSTQAGAVAATPCLRPSVLLRRCARSMRLCAMLLCWRQPRLALQCCVCVQSRPLGHSGHIGPHQATSGRSGIWAPRHRGTLAP